MVSRDLAALKIDRSVKPARSFAVPVLAVLGAGAVLAASYRFAVPLIEARFFKTEVAVAEIATISPAQAAVKFTSTGYVTAEITSLVASKIGGKVSAVYVKQGQRVNSGERLFQIDADEQKASIATALSQAASARARVETASAQLSELEIQANRAKALAAEGVGPSGSADDLAARVRSLQGQLKAAEAEVKTASALVHALQVNLVSFTVLAPIGGTIMNRPPDLGELVGPQASGFGFDMGGVEIADFDSLVVETDVPEQHLNRLKPGGPSEIVLDAFPDRRYRGKIVETAPRVDRAKATVLVKVAFVDDKDGVLPNMAVRVSFLAQELDKDATKVRPKTIVPESAVVAVQGDKAVYVIEGGRVHRRRVTLGPSVGTGFELVDGPRTGTLVVSEPPPGLVDGQAVKARTDS